ncbi:MAG: benzoate transporter, partial [Azoarcus sp.]|nr:benzoate transporter [Azoarcus sp.]
MKSAISFSLRLAMALSIAIAVALVQYLLWQYFNHGSNYVSATLSIKGFAYNGFQRDQSPLLGTYPSPAEVASDLDLLARHTDSLRTYGVRDLPDL